MGRPQPALQRLDVGEHLPLVVGRASSVKIPRPDRRLERRRAPFIERFGRLDVIVPVDQDGAFPRRVQPVGSDDRVVSGVVQLDVLQSDRAQLAGQPDRATPDIAGMPRLRADAGKADEFGKLSDEARARTPRIGQCLRDPVARTIHAVHTLRRRSTGAAGRRRGGGAACAAAPTLALGVAGIWAVASRRMHRT